MRKIVLIFVALSMVMVAEAQKRKVVSAYNYLNRGQLEKAKEAIDEAAKDESTMNDAKTWFYRGNVYLSIHSSEDAEYKSIAQNPLQTAYESYLESLELDDKDRYTADVKDRLGICAEGFFNKGVNAYKARKYAAAVESFEFAGETYNKAGYSDTLARYYAGVCASYGGMNDVAKKHFKYLMEKEDFDKEAIYTTLSKVYTEEKDTIKALEVIQKGLKKYPDSFNMIVAEANVYLAIGNTEKAIESLGRAIEKNPNNPNLHYAMGAKYNDLGYFEESQSAYKKAIELKPDYFDAYYNLGALYNNTAADLLKEANNLPFDANEKYDTLKTKADQLLKGAIPVLEAALKLKPDDKYTIQTLQQLYGKTGQTEKYKIMKNKMENKIEDEEWNSFIKTLTDAYDNKKEYSLQGITISGKSGKIDQIEVGMTKSEVTKILGAPNKTSTTKTSAGDTEMLFYDEGTINIDENGLVSYVRFNK